jgi:hypothetical protein
MKTAVAGIASLLLAVTACASSARAVPGLREQFSSAAKSIKMRSDPKTVEETVTNLGKPKVGFKWCRDLARCQDSEHEVDTNRMDVKYSSTQGDKHYMLSVMFCRKSQGSWQVAMVIANEYWINPKGASGPQFESEKLYQETDTGLRAQGCY